MPIWKAKAEPKCRFFAWTLMHKKILISNNLRIRHWPRDPICKLCRINPETLTHLCKDCSFTQQVRSVLKPWFGLSILDTINHNGSLHNFWHKCRMKIQKTQRLEFDGILIYIWWNIWKERNRRTFENKSLQTREVAYLCKEEINLFQRAMGPAPIVVV